MTEITFISLFEIRKKIKINHPSFDLNYVKELYISVLFKEFLGLKLVQKVLVRKLSPVVSEIGVLEQEVVEDLGDLILRSLIYGGNKIFGHLSKARNNWKNVGRLGHDSSLANTRGVLGDVDFCAPSLTL